MIQYILRVLAKLMLWRFRPRIVAVTGSVGKTTTKDAIEKVLSSAFSVRASESNYNNEIGLPLTILGLKSPGKNIFGWIRAIFLAVFKFFGKYPKILVLEMGTDKPGDISYLRDLVGKIEVAVITDIGISHLEFFAHPQELAKEKLTLIRNLSKTSVAVLNFDSAKVYEGQSQTRAEVIGYGFGENSALRISDFHLRASDELIGSEFKINHQGNSVSFFLPRALGLPAVYASAAAAAVGLKFNLDLKVCAKALKKFDPPPGRLRMMSGIKHTRIIDDTYNAAPSSTIAALEVLTQVSAGRKLAALGSMMELGSSTEEGHREVAAKIVANQIDIVFLVGELTKIIQDELHKRKFSGKVFWFATSDEAGIPIQNSLIPSDTILVKGSQASRMEKIVKEIMDKPLLAPKLLVRQTERWLSGA